MRYKALIGCAVIAYVAFTVTGCGRRPPEISSGVSWDLASHRARVLSDIRYEIALSVPQSDDEPIRGRETVSFRLSDRRWPLAIDFEQAPANVLAVRVSGEAVPYDAVDGHIVLPDSVLIEGQNSLEIEFWAGDNSLNRNPEFLYTLFVPDRARFAFPCFDQPNLKARFQLELELPDGWIAVANGEELRSEEEGGHIYRFAETKPISTYLFSFAAGVFEVVSAERSGRTMRMLHRETDTTKVARNVDAVFDLHEAALNWLEDYTGIEYPFDKFDFVLVPSFQYGGMEHPGAIAYRASSLFLDESATQNAQLRRASLIAHETSHMWFGDLVTMEWFNDVWMKEVFANFMAAKIVNPSFPEIDHELRFLLAHYPGAYGVDRTEGANPIRQRLDNLNQAGTLYGAIIYQKAPIVMKQLERLIGEETLRDGLRDYLGAYSFGNASWSDLIEILDATTEEDLASWSRVWVDEPRRPTIVASRSVDDQGHIASLVVGQSDPEGRSRIWNQQLNVRFGYEHTSRTFPVRVNSTTVAVPDAVGLPEPDYIIPNGEGVGYGLLAPDSASLEYFLDNTASLSEPLTRGIVWLSLWDAMLEGQVAPERLLDLAIAALKSETDQLLVQRVLDYLQSAYWRFLPADVRQRRAPEVEQLLWHLMEGARGPSLKAAYFNTFRSMALTDSALALLVSVWDKEYEIESLPLSEDDYTRLALELAVREVEGWNRILGEQSQRIENPDRKRQFEFVQPALSADPDVRDRFFAELSEVENREHEPWVLEAVRYLHHPLRAAYSQNYILPSLELLHEIQATGDIFFPKNWLDATLGGHNTSAAATVVRDFLQRRPDYPPKLRGKILQSADGLFRAEKILEAAS